MKGARLILCAASPNAASDTAAQTEAPLEKTRVCETREKGHRLHAFHHVVHRDVFSGRHSEQREFLIVKGRGLESVAKPQMNLVANLRRLKKRRVVVETKEGKRVEGVLEKVDREMNARVRDCKITHRGREEKHKSMVIRGSTIRYIIFDEDTDTSVFARDPRPRVKRRAGAESHDPSWRDTLH